MNVCNFSTITFFIETLNIYVVTHVCLKVLHILRIHAHKTVQLEICPNTVLSSIHVAGTPTPLPPQDFKKYTVPTNLWEQRCSHKFLGTVYFLKSCIPLSICRSVYAPIPLSICRSVSVKIKIH